MTPDTPDPRSAGARYYDLQPFPDDLGFYRALIGASRPSLLELGCGTGRVLLAVEDLCASVHGVERSAEMLALARAKGGGATYTRGDITAFDLGRAFDLILAPYHVFQALATDEQVEGLLACVRAHLAPGGACVLTTFRTRFDRPTLEARWGTGEEVLEWERELDGDRIVALARRAGIDPERLVLHPELVFRRYRGAALIEESVLPIVMRCWSPAQLTALLVDRGFRVTGAWGGYHGEAFGEGPELVVRFEDVA